MIRKRLIPTLLLNNEGLYKTRKFKNPVYLGDPINIVKLFNDKCADELCIIDIRRHAENTIDFESLESICGEAFMPVTYGGGIRNLDEIRQLFRIGVEKVILNSVLYDDLNVLKRAGDIYGSQSIMVGIDLKRNYFGNYHLYSHGGSSRQKISASDHINNLLSIGFGELIVTSIDEEGGMKGLDLELLNKPWLNIPVPLIASGGIGAWEHIETGFKSTKISGIAIGSYFVYHGENKGILITYPEENQIEKL